MPFQVKSAGRSWGISCSVFGSSQERYRCDRFLHVSRTYSITGNSVATFLASNLLSQKFAPGLVALCSAFLGVFAFQGVLSNTNITLFGKKALTFEEWMTKARDNAI